MKTKTQTETQTDGIFKPELVGNIIGRLWTFTRWFVMVMAFWVCNGPL